MTSIYNIAMVCHEANRAWCAANGDHSQPHWDNAPDWQTRSAILGVRHALAFPDATPAESHMDWMDAKFDDGWVYGEEKTQLPKHTPAWSRIMSCQSFSARKTRCSSPS